MGHANRVEKNESILNVTKNYRSLVVAVCLLTELLVSCSQISKTDEKQVAETFNKAMNFRPSGEPLTKIGANESPCWSTDGKHFLFVSRLRSAHKNSQIYEWDLDLSTERRVTFSDGDSLDPHYLTEGDRIIYSSTTDELKERPLLLQNKTGPAENSIPSDLYVSRLNGLDITRITNHPGFDGLIRISPTKDNEIYFVSEQNRVQSIFKLHLNLKTTSPIFPDQKEGRRDYVSLNGKIAWVAKSNPSSRQNLMYSDSSLKNAKPLNFGESIYQDLSWSPGAKKGDEVLLMTVAFPEAPKTQIVIYDPTKNCMASLVKSDQGQLSQASLSADRRRLLYVSDEIAGTPQILIKNMDWDHVICDRTQTAVTKR